MGSKLSVQEQLLGVLEMKMPINRVNGSDEINGRFDKIRAIARKEDDRLTIFVFEKSPSRTEDTIDNILADHNCRYEKEDSTAEFRTKYVIKQIDDSTFI